MSDTNNHMLDKPSQKPVFGVPQKKMVFAVKSVAADSSTVGAGDTPAATDTPILSPSIPNSSPAAGKTKQKKIKDSLSPKIKKAKQIKDLHAPKKPLTPFFKWSVDEREKCKEELSNLSMCDKSKEMGERWKNLAEEIKQAYVDAYKEEKEAYELAMASYEPSQEYLMLKADAERKVAEKKMKMAAAEEKKEQKALKLAQKNAKSGQGMKTGQMQFAQNYQGKYLQDDKERNSSRELENYFKFITENWRRAADESARKLANPGPLEVEDVLHHMWANQVEANLFRKQRTMETNKQDKPKLEPAYTIFYQSMIGPIREKLPSHDIEDLSDILESKWESLDEDKKNVFREMEKNNGKNLE